MKILSDYFVYILSLRQYLFFSLFLFIFGIVSGYFIPNYFPEITNGFIDSLIDKYSPFFEQSQISQFWFIFLSNAATMFFVSVAGIIFGLFPFTSLFINGVAVGIIANFSREFIAWKDFFMAILPHGVIEVPVLILGGAIGFNLAASLFGKIFKKQFNTTNIKREISLAFQVYYKILLPLLFLAAIIEVFITARLIS